MDRVLDPSEQITPPAGFPAVEYSRASEIDIGPDERARVETMEREERWLPLVGIPVQTIVLVLLLPDSSSGLARWVVASLVFAVWAFTLVGTFMTWREHEAFAPLNGAVAALALVAAVYFGATGWQQTPASRDRAPATPQRASGSSPAMPEPASGRPPATPVPPSGSPSVPTSTDEDTGLPLGRNADRDFDGDGSLGDDLDDLDG